MDSDLVYMQMMLLFVDIQKTFMSGLLRFVPGDLIFAIFLNLPKVVCLFLRNI